MLVRYREAAPLADGTRRHTMQVDAFLDADGIGLEVVTRTLQPLVCRSSADNLHEICLFMAEFSATADENPAGVARLATRLTNVSAADRAALVALIQPGGATPAVAGGSARQVALERLRDGGHPGPRLARHEVLALVLGHVAP